MCYIFSTCMFMKEALTAFLQALCFFFHAGTPLYTAKKSECDKLIFASLVMFILVIY